MCNISMKYCILPAGHQEAKPRLWNEGSKALDSKSKDSDPEMLGLSGIKSFNINSSCWDVDDVTVVVVASDVAVISGVLAFL